jgi:hypothetical protein
MKNKHYRGRFLWLVYYSVCFFFCSAGCYSQSPADKIFIGERIRIYSKVLDEDRKILIRLPGDYRDTKRNYPVLYLLDGEYFFLQAASAAQYLSELGYMRESNSETHYRGHRQC